MERAKVLKANNIKVDGKFKLDFNSPAQKTSTSESTATQPQQTQKPKTETKQQSANETQNNNPKIKAVIIENTPQAAIIEITCTCGEKMMLQCNYQNQQ